MRSRRVGFLTTGLGRGGAELQLTLLATGLASRGWDVRVMSMLPLDGHAPTLAAAGIEVVSLEMQRGKAQFRQLFETAQILGRWRPDVLVTFMVHANLLGRAAGTLARVPTIVSSVRNERFGGRHWERLLALTDRLAAATVANSGIVARSLTQRRLVAPERLHVIPNGIVAREFRDVSTHRASVRQELGVEPSDFLWLAVGSLHPQKDHATLVEAFREVLQALPEARLAIVGAGPLSDELEHRLSTLELGERVQLLGLRTDVPRLLGGADAFVLSSAWEGLPNAVMEAMAARLPVVATSVGGVAELIADRESGIVVPAKQPHSLAVGMRDVMRMSSSQRLALTERAAAHLERTFEAESVVERWEALLMRLACSGTPGAEFE